MSDSEALELLGKGKRKVMPKPETIDFAQVTVELQRKGVTLALLWQEGLDKGLWQLSYGGFCRRYNRWRAQHQLSMAQPTYHDLSFDDRFSLLVERKHLRRAQQRLHKRLKQAQLSTSVCLTDIDFSVSRGLSKSKFLELAQGQWVHDGLHLILVGPTGIGKTFLSSVLADQSCKQGHRSLFPYDGLTVGVEMGESRWLFSQIVASISRFWTADS